MKKLYSLLLTAAAFSLSLTAQQLPNNSFDEAWQNCVPWTSNNNTTAQGTQPSPWNISNTRGAGGTGATTVGTQVTGRNSGYCVKLTNQNVLSKKVPGYLSLGTGWSTAKGITGGSADGGTFGGHWFSYRPDALSFYYKRDSNTENSTVVIYSWKGTYTQLDVPGNIVVSGNPTKVIMTNRERNVIGMATSQGGEVSSSADAELVAQTTHYISEAPSDWTNLVIPIDYISTSSPEWFNVIFACGEYFESSPKTNGKSFYIDDVVLLYYSRLASLSVNGAAVAGFDSNTYNYTIDAQMPEASAFAYTTLGNSGSGRVNVSLDTENAVATITVTNANAGGTDVDGATQHVYTLQFNKPTGGETPEEPVVIEGGDIYKGLVTVKAAECGLGDENIVRRGKVHIIEQEDGSITFALPDFSLDDTADGYIGNIVVHGLTVTDEGGVRHYNGSINPLALKLGENDIYAKVTVDGTVDAAGHCVMNVGVIWLMDPENDPEGEEFGFEIPVFFESYGGDMYTGSVTIQASDAGLGDEDIVRNGTVYIMEDEGGETATFILPDFSLDDTEEGYIGDIVVPGLIVTKSGSRAVEAKSYQGQINPLKLKLGEDDIYAKVGVMGEVNEAGNCTMYVSVVWLMDPENDPEGEEYGVEIPVLFNGDLKETAGIGDIKVDAPALENVDAPVEYFNIKGMRLDSSNLAPGIYIRRQGNKITKVVVK